VSFQLTGRKSYGHVASLDQAQAAFRAEYEAWKNGARLSFRLADYEIVRPMQSFERLHVLRVALK
jgi:hypothetical protein